MDQGLEDQPGFESQDISTELLEKAAGLMNDRLNPLYLTLRASSGEGTTRPNPLRHRATSFRIPLIAIRKAAPSLSLPCLHYHP